MRFQPTITYEQYRDTYRAVATVKTKEPAKRQWSGYVGIGLICLVVGLSPQMSAARVPVFVIFGVFILCRIFSKSMAERSQEKCLMDFFLDEQEGLNNQVLSIDESGIYCDQGNGQVTSHHTWMAFKKFIDMSDAYVFLPSPNSFVRVPKVSLSPSDLELVLQWSESIPKASIR